LAPLYKFADHLRFRRHGDIGRRGEDLAHRYLRSNGFVVAARNWRPPQGGGEIDLIVWESAPGKTDLDRLVFVEVKSRAKEDGSAPERAVDLDKIRALRRAARDYIRRSEVEEGRARFDVITITGMVIEHLRDAFSL
jgi:putative endonuclease